VNAAPADSPKIVTLPGPPKATLDYTATFTGIPLLSVGSGHRQTTTLMIRCNEIYFAIYPFAGRDSGDGALHRRCLATMCYMCDTFRMNRMITQRELRNQSASVLREVEAGRTIVVTRNGTPVAELRPIRPRRFAPRETLAEAAVRAPRVDADQFRADLNVVIDQRIDG
jgi:prevent-host-death family protein